MPSRPDGLLQHDHLGKPIGVLETHTDVTERVAAHAALVQSERRYRRMFDASRIGVVEEDWTGIRTALKSLNVDSNRPARLSRAQSRLCPAGADRSQGSPTSIRRCRKWSARTALPPSSRASTSFWARATGRSSAHWWPSPTGEPFYEGETELVGLDGRRVPVLFTITFPPPSDGDRNVLAFVVDITERRQAQDALLAAQAELAHAARVATLGELTASIAHEVNQPLAAIVTSGEAGLRWLRRDVPNLEEVAAAIGRVVAEGRRAGEIVTRIRAFLKKTPAQQDMLQIGEIIEEAALLVERELSKDNIVLDHRDRAGSAAGSRRPDSASAGSRQSHGQCRPGDGRTERAAHRHGARRP